MTDDSLPPDNEPQTLTYKELMKQRRREQYQVAKEAYKSSDHFKVAKERQKDYRKEQYRKAKGQKKEDSSAEKPPLPRKTTEALPLSATPAADLPRPKLRLIKNTDP